MAKLNNGFTGMFYFENRSPRGAASGRLMIFLLLMLGTAFSMAQSTGTIRGIVTDARTGKALPGVNIVVEGSFAGSASSIDGDYSLDIAPGTYVVSAQFVGFKVKKQSVTVAAGEKVQVDFAMEEDVLGTETVAVIGTRRTDRTVVESPVPVDVITEVEIRQANVTETTQVLALLVPSYNAPRPSISDGSDHMRPATLRGLGPDQVLILVNGKRRHTGALVHVNGTVGRGSTGADLNSIPASAIKRVEVLRDGAAAQYGSDAISGVINIVLKDNTGFDAAVNYSQSLSTVSRGYDELEGNLPRDTDLGNYSWDGGGLGGPEDVTYTDGLATNLHLGYGLPIGDNGNLYISGQFRAREETNRAGIDPRQQYFDGDSREGGFDRISHRYGNGKFDEMSGFLNFNLPIGTAGTQFYAFGGFNRRNGETGCFYRRANDNRTVRSIHPDGFLPILDNTLTDVSGAAGIRGVMGGWAYDLSETYGTNSFGWGVANSNNVSLGGASQTDFDAGTLKFAQATTNLDLVRGVDIGTASPLNVAIGAEFRFDQYQIEPGEEASYVNGGMTVLDGPNAGSPAAVGSQCFPGFSPRNATDETRTNFGAYVDLENQLYESLLVGVAGRFENYSDFGSTVTGKVAARYVLSEWVALRGAFSTGFRSPSLAQANYSAIATNFIDGVPFEVGTFPVSDPVAQALGAQELDAETSINISYGITYTKENFTFTVDAYQINIKDRIVFTENFTGGSIREFLATRSIDANGGRYFTNAVETETQGVDIIARFAQPVRTGTLRMTMALNLNNTEITNKDEIETPAALANFTSTPLFGRVEQGRFELGQPKAKMNLTGNYLLSDWNFMARVQRYGSVTELSSSTPTRDQIYSPKWITDAEASYKLNNSVSLSAGVNNLFDIYPDKQYKINSFNGVFPYDGLSPFGFFGREIYARLNLSM